MEINIEYLDFIDTDNNFIFINGCARVWNGHKKSLKRFVGKISNNAKILTVCGRKIIAGITLYDPLNMEPLHVGCHELRQITRKIFERYKARRFEPGAGIAIGYSATCS